MNGSPNLGQTSRLSDCQQKKRTCRIVNFAVPADHSVKSLKREKKNKFQDLARELKKNRCNIKVTVMPILIRALGTISKGFIQGLKDLEIRGKVETFQTTALLRSARILRRVLET